MHALDFEGELLDEAPINERPTIPVPPPRESGVRLRVARVSALSVSATIDVVVCDLSRDPRSEDYRGDEHDDAEAPRTMRQPAMTNIRALALVKTAIE